jgi:hypothetical protein
MCTYSNASQPQAFLGKLFAKCLRKESGKRVPTEIKEFDDGAEGWMTEI